MPRYFFHVRDEDRLIEDQDGSELPDLEAARTEAAAAAREILAEQIRTGKEMSGRSFEITDDTGKVLATVTLRDVAGPH